MASNTTFKQLSDKDVKEELLQALAAIAGSSYSADQGVAYHVDPPNKISLPEGMTPGQGAKALTDVEKAMAQREAFTRTFKYRPWDGAFAVVQVLMKHFGTSGRGRAIQTLFGSIPPRQIEIEIGPKETVQVPWGEVDFAHFDGTLYFGSTEDKEYGQLFQLTLECPKRYAASVTGFFNLIQDQLEQHSIYKGKSIKDAHDTPRFLDLKVNDTIVYTDEVESGLTNTVWGVIANADLLKLDGRKTNTRVLLHGPYGTGKSECGNKTASIANEYGRTFLSFHSGRGTLDELEATIATARLYQPSIVFIEDIDVYASKDDADYQSRLSNLFDGIGSKGDDVMILMTSNKAASFSKGMLRAGRVDRMIEVGPLDRDATETLIKKVIGEDRLEEVDFDVVWEAMRDFEPAFVRKTFDDAATAAIIRTGSRTFKLRTEDLVGAANLLRPQHEMHTNRSDESKKVTFDSLMNNMVENVLTNRVKGKLNTGDYSITYESQPVS